MKNRPKVVFIGGIETGKTTTIQLLWEEEAVSLKEYDGFMEIGVHEMIPGREFIDFDVIEVPRIHYTSDNWYKNNSLVRNELACADVIVITIPINDIAIMSHKQYIKELFSFVQLKPNSSIIIAASMSDKVLTPIVASKYQVAKTKKIGLTAVTNVLKRKDMFFSVFEDFKDYDKTFSPSSIVPISYPLMWNIENLKYQIWNGIVVSMNNYAYDPSLPTLVLAGKTGCGKTSTINALWNKKLAVDKAVSCTKFPAVMHIEDTYDGKTIKFNLVDLPGIAESLDANTIYKSFYYKYINHAKLLICLSQADRRAYKQDELFYLDLIGNKILRNNQNIILGINQADLLFKSTENLDGIDLHTINEDDAIIQEKIYDYYNGIFRHIFKDFLNVKMESVHIYSIAQQWNLEQLRSKIYKLLIN